MRVAIAGATGTVASHIINSILSTSRREVVALTRSESSELSARDKMTVKVVDYANVSSLTTALQGCDVVISTLFSRTDPKGSLGDSQLNLVEAAHKAGVKRFAPSEFEILPSAKEVMQIGEVKAQIVEKLEEYGIEYIIFMQGIFMNSFCAGSPDEKEGLAGLQAAPFINVKDSKAMIPGDGDQKFSTTDVRDVGAFVAASLALEKWNPMDGAMSGSILTYNELVDKVEAVVGKKLERTYLPKDKLREMANKPVPDGFKGQAMLSHVLGYANVGTRLNELYPDLKARTIDEFLQRYWGKQ